MSKIMMRIMIKLFQEILFFNKRINETLDDGYEFLKMFDILIADIENIFYKEECGEEETRQKRLNDLGI